MSVFASRWVRLLVSIGLLAAVIWLADWRAIWAVLRTVEVGWIWAAVGLAALDRLLLNYRWQLLLAARGLLLGFLRLLRVQLAANFLGSFLPSSLGVDAIRITALCRAGFPSPQVVASTLVDRASIVLATLLFGSAMVLALAGRRLPDELRNWVLLCTGGAVLACLIFLYPPLRRWLGRRLLAWLPERIRSVTSDIASATLAYRLQYRYMASVTLVTAIIFLIRILFAKSLALACGADLSIADVLLVIPILWIIVMLPITIGGIGLQDAGYVALMAIVGVPPAIAVSMSLLEHLATRLVAVPGAFFLREVTRSPPQRVDA